MTNWQHYGKIERPQKDKQQYIKHKFKTELHELDVNRCKNISRSGSTCGTIRVAYASTNSVSLQCYIRVYSIQPYSLALWFVIYDREFRIW